MEQAIKSVVDIGKGEPDFATPEHIKEAARRALAEDFTRYTPQPGIPELREAAAEKFRTENGIDVSPDRVVVSCGGKHSLYNAFQCLLSPGDEVLVPTPHWFAYTAQIAACGARPVLVPASPESGFLPDIEDLRRARTSATRAIVLNSPHNPTGAVYDRARLEAIAALAAEHDLYIVSDEVYEKIVFDDARHLSVAAIDPEIARRTVTVNSVSKTHAMTGWRIGYAALPGDLARRVIALQGNSTSAPSAISQRAALAALTGDASHVATMVAAYARRRAWLLDRLEALPGLRCVPPRGAFYCFVNMEERIGTEVAGEPIGSADDFVRVLRERAGVSMVSGTPFGADRRVRISFAVSESDLAEGVDRMAEALLL